MHAQGTLPRRGGRCCLFCPHSGAASRSVWIDQLGHTGARGNSMALHARDRARGSFVPLSDGTRRRQVQCRGEDPGEIVRAAARLASARRARNGQQQVRSHVGLWGFHYDM